MAEATEDTVGVSDLNRPKFVVNDPYYFLKNNHYAKLLTGA